MLVVVTAAVTVGHGVFDAEPTATPVFEVLVSAKTSYLPLFSLGGTCSGGGGAGSSGGGCGGCGRGDGSGDGSGDGIGGIGGIGGGVIMVVAAAVVMTGAGGCSL